MDLFKLGLRSVLGITLPGAMLVLVVGYFIFALAFFLEQPLRGLFWTKDQQFLILAVAFLVSYNLGALLRLNSADDVDRRSSKVLTRQYIAEREGTKEKLSEEDLQEELRRVRDAIRRGEISAPPASCDRWIWCTEPFPYPLWQLRKFQLYHPREVSRFFHPYQSCLLSSGGRGKEFFNYCKLVIYHASRSQGDPLLDEVHFAEATVRFYAGTYTGLVISTRLLGLLLVIEAVILALRSSKGALPGALQTEGLLFFATAALLLVCVKMRRGLLHRFRTLRLKEVDTVYDAFYLVHRHVDSCERCALPAPEGKRRAPAEEGSPAAPRLLPAVLSILRILSEVTADLRHNHTAGNRDLAGFTGREGMRKGDEP